MGRASLETAPRPSPRSKKANVSKRPRSGKTLATSSGGFGSTLSLFAILLGAVAVYVALQIHAEYTFNLQSPIQLGFQWPVVAAKRTRTADAAEAQWDQRHPLNAYQQYACTKFGSACRVALAIQRAENPQGKCEIYHYNTDGTLDWGYFQINTVHLKRPGLNLRDLLDCRANIDFAYQLYIEKQGFSAWSTYKNGLYRQYLRQ